MIWAVGQKMGLTEELRRVCEVSWSTLTAENLCKPSQYCSKWRDTEWRSGANTEPHPGSSCFAETCSAVTGCRVTWDVGL